MKFFIRESISFFMDLDSAQKKAEQLAKEAGQIILQCQRSHNEKKDGSPVTEADTQADAFLLTELKAYYPECGFLTEESDDSLSRLEKDWVWIIDPLDGTKEFINHEDEFTVNIALVHKGIPVLGIIYAPAKEDLYSAQKGKGATKNGKRIQVSTSSDIRILMSKRHRSPLDAFLSHQEWKDVISVGSSLKGCWIAEGRAEACIRLTQQKEWDVAAMFCIVEAAGGKITDFQGKLILFNKENILVTNYILSNTLVHKKLLSLIQSQQ